MVALSVGGVMVAMKSQAQQRAAKRVEPGKHARGPAGHREVGCGTVSLYDSEGKRLQTVRYARMPESKAVRPDLRRVHLADGAEGNWQLLAKVETALGRSAETWIEIVDFYHACDHLKNSCDAIWGESTPRSQAEFLRLKTLLKEEDDGADRILRSFKHHASRARGNRQRRIPDRTDLLPQATPPHGRRRLPTSALADWQWRRRGRLQDARHAASERFRDGLVACGWTSHSHLTQPHPE